MTALPRSMAQEWRTPLILLALTFVSTFWVGAGMRYGQAVKDRLLKDGTDAEPIAREVSDLVSYYLTHLDALAAGWTFAIPLMAILIAHEMGHYVAGRIHRVDISPPYFIPMPFFLLGTMGAVIRMRGQIKTANALLDIGAAGPLAGMAVALPVLVYGLSISHVGTLDGIDGEIMVEGRGLLYLALLYLMKGPMGPGQDVWLSPTAMAGWAGLLVTQINLIPVAQLDGGHVAYALFGKRQDRYSTWVHRALPFVGAAVSLMYLVPAYLAGERGAQLEGEAIAGMHWVLWALVLGALMRFSGREHPPVGAEPLSRGRKWVAAGTLVLFVLLFMPSWIYVP